MQNEQAFLVLKDVTKSFGKTVVIDHLDLAIERQRAVTLDHIVLRHAEVRADDRRMRRGNGTRNATRQRGSRGYFAEHS